VTAGRPEGDGAPLSTPVELSSTYHAGGDVTYGREGNATWAALEEAIGALEGGTAVVFASGMGAVAAVLGTLPVGATVVVAGDAYQGTRRFLHDLAARRPLSVRAADVTDASRTLELCPGAQLLRLGTPTHPPLA